MTESRSPEQLSIRMEELWSRFRPGIIERVDRLEAAVVALLSGTLDADQRRLAEREAHKLAGSVGTFGFAEASRFARSIEQALEGERPLEPQDALHLSEWVLALRSHLGRAPTAELPDRSRPALLLLTGDADLAERIEMEAGSRGYDVRRTEDESSTRAMLTESEPAAVVLDLPVPGARDPYTLLEEISASAGRPPIIVLAHGDGFAERVEAVRRGVTVYIRKPVSPLAVVDAVERTLMRGGGAGSSVLVVDDDAQILRLLEAILGARGMQVRGVEDVTSFWRELSISAPDAVVLDVDMPELNGIELCRAIRADARWEGLPILFLSARTDPLSVEAIFQAGADDYVAKPLVGPELVTRIENRLARVGTRGGPQEQAVPGGLPARKESRDVLRRLLQLAQRASTEMTLARVAVANLDSIARALGPAAAQQALSRVAGILDGVVEPGDVVGWWGGGEFTIGCFAADGPAVGARLEQARTRLAAERVAVDGEMVGITFSAGVSSYPRDGTEVDSLLSVAEAALATAFEAAAAPAAQDAGTASTAPVQSIDVVVVEDDTVVAELLLHALTVQGYTSRWIADGDEALRRLGEPSPSLRARVLLLDVDLPGRDGLSVLRELSRQRVTSRTRVVMLTVRSTEREVLTALELGAADHVAKPFSVPVLLRRVRSLLERV